MTEFNFLAQVMLGIVAALIIVVLADALAIKIYARFCRGKKR